MDFVADQLQHGARFRALTVVDVFKREAVAIGAWQSLKGDDAVRTLNCLKLDREVAKVLSCENGRTFARESAARRSLFHITPLKNNMDAGTGILDPSAVVLH
jgi:hypothetical protein